ncbi:MAG: hypothetical protein E6614_35935, partial [Bradyrhizobium sp.]|nr:hypothetical protein [Bradyrhizobium sp.]
MPRHLLPTTVVGSYPQPDWLVDRAMLAKSVPRIRMQGMWRIQRPLLDDAQDDATIVAIHDMEQAGIDIVSDGEIRRESYSNRFATALDGIDADNPAIIVSPSGLKTPVPRVVGPIRRKYPIELRDMEFLRRNTSRAAKITLPGPFTLAQQAQDDFYRDDEALAMAFAEEVKKQTNGAVNITVKAGGQLGFKGPEHLRAVRDGLVPLADVLNIQQVGDEPFMGVESIPFLAGSMDELKVLHKYVRPEYEKIAARNNQKILYIVPWPTQYLHLKVKTSDVAGLKNIKIRVPDK